MRKFLAHIVLFLLPVFVVVVLVFYYPVERSFSYHYMPGDCENRSSWLYGRMLEDTTAADIVFFGSSHTMTGVQDMTLETLLTARTGKTVRVANLGYCRIGEELPYVLLKDLLRTKKPQLVVLEVRERISTSSQPVYPFLAERRDLLCPPSFAQQAYLPNVYNGWLLRLAALRTDLVGPADTVTLPEYSRFGYRFSGHTGDPSALAQVKANAKNERAPGFLHGAETHYPDRWIAQLEELAAENGITVCFLYLPSYGGFEKKPEFLASRPGGIFLLPPPGLLDDPSSWRDPDHLNNTGAAALTEWLAGELPAVK
jgi:hypothetical protein